MSSAVRQHLEELLAATRTLRLLTVLSLVLVPVFLWCVLATAGFHPFLLAGTVAYGGAKLYRWASRQRQVRQLRYEHLLARRCPTGSALRSLLKAGHHLWDNSILVEALRLHQARPLPVLLLLDEKTQMLHERYETVLRPLQARWLDPEAMILPLLAAGWIFLLPVSTWTGLVDAVPFVIVGTLGAAMLLEVLHALFLRRRRAAYEGTVDAMVVWTIEGKLEEALRPGRTPTYNHQTLYHARPWFQPEQPLSKTG